jgi:hypothetical protein
MFGWYQHKKNLLGYAYLFLSAEDKISDADLALFEEIGKSIDGFQGIKKEIIDKCESILSGEAWKPRFEIVSDILFYNEGSTYANNCAILLVLMGLANVTGKSDKKQQLIERWVKGCGIGKSIVLEMLDINETQNAIEEYKQWLEANKGMSHKEVHSIMQELEKNEKSLEQSVSDLIALG